MTKLSIDDVSKLFEEHGLQLVSTEYKNNKTPLICIVQTGKLTGYTAQMSVDGVHQRINKGTGVDYTLSILTVSERCRFISDRCVEHGYSVVTPPENGSSTKPMKVRNLLGNIEATTWNVLETRLKVNKAGNKKGMLTRSLKINDWATKFDVTVTSLVKLGRGKDRIAFTFNSGEYKGCTGSILVTSVRQMREPTLRSLDEQGFITYCRGLCNRWAVTFISLVTPAKKEKTNQGILFQVKSGVYQGYKGVRTVANIRQALDKQVEKHTIEALTLGERARFITNFTNHQGYTVNNFPEQMKVTKQLELICPNGHLWAVTWDNFYRGNRCARCASSYKGERFVEAELVANGLSYVPQYAFKTEEFRTQYFDFYLPDYAVAIEYNGRQHYEPLACYGGQEEFELTQKRDQAKREYCLANGITLIDIPYTMSEEELKEKLKKALTKD